MISKRKMIIYILAGNKLSEEPLKIFQKFRKVKLKTNMKTNCHTNRNWRASPFDYSKGKH